MSAINGNRRRVVVTGMGLVTPLGTTVEANWEALTAGRSGIGPITRFDASTLPVRVAGEVRGFSPDGVVEPKDLKKIDIFIQYALVAAHEALADAGLPYPVPTPERVGVIVGVGMGGISTVEENVEFLTTRNVRRLSPFFIPRLIPNMAAGHISIEFGARGPSYVTASACASGANAVGEATELIRDGRQDIMVAGGAEAPVNLLGVGGFCAMRALAGNFADEPTRVSRPFDRDRDGFVVSEGAGVLILEELEHARRRGAQIYAEVVGYASGCDAYHMTQPSPEGEGAAACMTQALLDAGLAPERVGYINAHGTGTPHGDVAETIAIKRVFGAHAMKLAVSSTKSMTGHLLGGAGTVEAAYTILALARGLLPPTINLDHPDPACDLDYVPHRARSAQLEVTMSNSFGFGGTNATLVFRHLT